MPTLRARARPRACETRRMARSRRGRRSVPLPPPPPPRWEQDPAPVTWELDDPTAIATSEAFQTGDWRQVRSVLVNASAEARSALLARATHDIPPLDLADAWVQEDPDDALGHLVRGWVGHSSAWQLRTTPDTGTSDIDEFARRLLIAEAHFRRGADLDPLTPDPWIGLVQTGRSLQIPQAEVGERFDAAITRRPWSSVAVDAMGLALSPRWLGTPGEALAFGKLIADEAPDGSASIAALARAHFECAFASRSTEQLASPHTRVDLCRAAERSIHHPDFVLDLEGLVAVNLFAAAFWFGEHRPQALRVLDLAAGRYCPTPWADFESPGVLLRWIELEGRHRPTTSLWTIH